MSEAPPPLLHSLAEFAPLIVPILDAVAPRRLVEIGGEGGTLTTILADWAADHDATVTCIDPVPSADLRALGRSGRAELVEAKSPGVLAELDPFDLYVVDGDHNHSVVSRELSAIFGDAGRTPIALMHDVAWPAARRDQYYDPADVPEEERRPYSYTDGALPGHDALVPKRGFHGAGTFAYATEEGGRANGVLTAVDDLLAERDDLELRRVPAIFGFGALYPSAAPWAAAVRAVMDPFHENPLLARMERNRLDLYLDAIDRREAVAAMARGQRDHVAGLQREIEQLRARIGRLTAGEA